MTAPSPPRRAGTVSRQAQQGKATGKETVMKLRSDKITAQDVRNAVGKARIKGADIWIDDLREFRPRGYAHGVEFWCESRNGKRATGHRPVGSYPLDEVARAAAWDAYGWVISYLYTIDPDAVIGTYNNVDDYRSKVERASYRKEPKDFIDVVDGIHATR